MSKRRLTLRLALVVVLPLFPPARAGIAIGSERAAGALPINTVEAVTAVKAVKLVFDDHPGEPVRYAMDEITRALEALTLAPQEQRRPAAPAPVIIAGLSKGNGPAARLLRDRHIEAPSAPESLVISRTADRPETWLVTAPDDRGLMYALLDIADRIRWAASPATPLSEVREAREAPAIAERAISIYTMQRAWFESRFFDQKQWERYFDLLARSRFNSFVLIFGYENAGYFAPAYPYFFDVDGFPGVHVEGFSASDQQRYSQALHRLIALAHARGLSVTLGLWDHIYRGGVQAGGMDVQPGRPSPGIVTGLGQDNLMAYSQAALSKFVQTFSDVDVLQFRMHTESGLKTEEMHDFWKAMYEIMRQRAPRMRFDARVKDLPDELIDLASDMGVSFRLNTKYWAEQVGLPFHPTHVNRPNQLDRRHGYADLLRYPKKYDIDWQLWTAGTTRVLLWGDPEYTRRFVESCHLYDGKGFEVNEMLATKMASQPHDMAPFDLLAPAYRYYDYEFERYWHFYQLFGRIGYDPDTPAQVWDREFERRFGRETAPFIEHALHRASWILPMITAYNFPYSRFPATRGWPERQRREDLPEYAKAEPSDTEQFLGMTEAARLLLAGEDSAKVWPQQSSRWFASVADEVSRDVAEAERRRSAQVNPELASTLVDLKILANLATYHSRRAEAGFAFALWNQTHDLSALDHAIAFEARAIDAWAEIVRAAGDVYAPNMRMGLARSDLTGHWRDELEALKRGLAALQRSRQEFRPEMADAAAKDAPRIAHVPVRRLRPGEDLVVEATVTAARPIARVQFAYRVGDRFGDVALEPAGPFTYRARVPSTRFGGSFSYIIHANDETGRTATWPAVVKESGARGADSRSLGVPPSLRFGALGRSGSGGQGPPAVEVVVSDDEDPPRVRHVPVTAAPAARPLRIVADVTDRSGVKWVRLRYRAVNQYQDFKTLEMHSTAAANEYEAVVPVSDIDPRFDLMYFLEVMDNAGNGAIYPDFRTEQPYVIVRLDRQ